MSISSVFKAFVPFAICICSKYAVPSGPSETGNSLVSRPLAVGSCLCTPGSRDVWRRKQLPEVASPNLSLSAVYLCSLAAWGFLFWFSGQKLGTLEPHPCAGLHLGWDPRFATPYPWKSSSAAWAPDSRENPEEGEKRGISILPLSGRSSPSGPGV